MSRNIQLIFGTPMPTTPECSIIVYRQFKIFLIHVSDHQKDFNSLDYFICEFYCIIMFDFI